MANISRSRSQQNGCAKEQKVCAKCRYLVDQIVGRDSADFEEEQKMLEEAIKNALERDRRTLLCAMNKSKSKRGNTGSATRISNVLLDPLFAQTMLCLVITA